MQNNFPLIMMITAISILCNNFSEINEQEPAKLVLYWKRDTDELVWSRRRQVQRCLSVIGALAKLFSFVVWEAWMRTLIVGYLLLISPGKDYAVLAALVSLSLSLIKLILLLTKFCFSGLFPADLMENYDQTVDFCYKAVILISVTLIISEVLIYCWIWLQQARQAVIARIEQEIIPYLAKCLLRVASHCRPEGLSGYGNNILFGLGVGLVCANDSTVTPPDTPESVWREKLRAKDGMLIVEENEDFYRVRIAIFHWKFSKEDEFGRKIFALLLATARDEQDKPVVNSRTLAQAMGWSHHDLLNRLVRAWENAGNSFRGVIERHSKAGHGKLFRAVLAILRQDFSLSLLEIHSQIIERQERWARQATIGQINVILKQISFGEIHEDLREYCVAQKQRHSAMKFSEDQVKIERSATGYRVILGNLFWEIERTKIFTWIAIIHTLLTARTDENKRITGVVRLADMLGLEYYQKLQTLLERYRYIAQRFGDLSSVPETIAQSAADNRLRQLILQMWLEDITLSAQEILRRLKRRPDVANISIKKVRRLMRDVDFWPVRMALAKQYRKGQYRKSTEWVIDKYRQTINYLLTQLAQGKSWSKAEIDEYLGALPESIRPAQPGSHGTLGQPVSKSWLKCFLFGLPKVVDNQPCCPKCGSFNTTRRSSTPVIQTVSDLDTGRPQQVATFRFRCNNPLCSCVTFTAPIEDTHILEQARFAKACLMLRQVMVLHAPYRALANLLGTTKSVVFNELTYISHMAEHWDEILGPVRFSGTICIDEKHVKIAAFKKFKKRPFGYLFLAVDPATGDLLHVEVFAASNKESAEAFLMQLKAKGIYPTTIMTDLTENYDQPVRRVYGRSVTMARCFFHFKQNIFKHMHDQFGKKDVPQIAEDLKEAIFDVVDAKSKKTIKKRYDALIQAKPHYLQQQPKLLPMFNCLQSYYPHLMRVTENQRVPIRTNNPVELVIRHFCQRYKAMSGFKSLETARRHARLFQIVYRFTPLSDDIEDKTRRGLAPLELAGYQIRHMPIYQYLTAPLLFNIKPEQNLCLLQGEVA